MQSRWILLAEDNDDDLALALRAIKKAKYEGEMVVARDGLEALRQLGLTEGCAPALNPPELVILDIKMPLMSGLEVLSEIRKCEPFRYVPIAMMSSSDEPSDMAQAYESGANSYTIKPVNYDDFNDQIATMLRYWTSVNRVPRLIKNQALTP